MDLTCGGSGRAGWKPAQTLHPARLHGMRRARWRTAGRRARAVGRSRRPFESRRGPSPRTPVRPSGTTVPSTISVCSSSLVLLNLHPVYPSHALAHDIALTQRSDRTAEFRGQLGDLTHGQVAETVLTFSRGGHITPPTRKTA